MKLWKLTGETVAGVVSLALVASSGLAAGEAPAGLGRLSAGMMGQTDDAGGGSFLDSLTFNGSVEMGYTYNFNDTTNAGGTTGGENPVRVFDRFHNEFTVHNAILNIKREVSETQLFGFAVTPTIGTDSNVTGGGGFDFGTTNTGDLMGNTDIDVLNAYVALYVPPEVPLLEGTTLKFGKFITFFGGEVIESYKNANFSRSILFGNAIPFTHTGVLAEKPLIERDDGGELVGVSLGLTNGWDSLRSTNDGFAMLASLRLAPATYMSAALNYSFGVIDRNGLGDNNDNSNLIDLVGNFEVPETGLSLLLNFDWYGDENTAAGGPYADYYGFAGTVKYDFPNPLSISDENQFYLAFRGEFFDDPDQFFGTTFAVPGGPTGEQIWALTWTLGYAPADFLLLRAEVRFDKADAALFENNSRSQQTTIAFSSVFKF